MKNHVEERLCGYHEATSHDISQEIKAWSQKILPNGQAYFLVHICDKMAYGQ